MFYFSLRLRSDLKFTINLPQHGVPWEITLSWNAAESEVQIVQFVAEVISQSVFL